MELCARILNEAHADPGRIASYLRHRGLSGEVPPALRLHPSLTCEGRQWPTMVAPFVDPRGKLVGIHRTFLATDGPGKAPVKSPKKFLGQVTGAAIHLDEPRAGVLATSEGIENGLVAREVLSLPVWVAGSAAGLAAMELPDELRQLWIFADNDKAGYERGAVPLAERAAAAGIEVYVLRSRLKDWLDELLVHGPEALREAKEAARPWKPAVVFRSYGREVERLLSHLAEGEPCQKIREHRAELFVACKAGTDTKRLLTALYRLLREGARGHPGAREVLEDAWLRFSERSKDEDALVWQRWKRLVTDAAQGISDVLAREEKGDCRCGTESDFWGSGAETEFRLDTETEFWGLSDAHLADIATEEELRGRFYLVVGIGWMQWNGRHWERCSEEQVIEAVRGLFLRRWQQAKRRQKRLEAQLEAINANPEGWSDLDVAKLEKKVAHAARVTKEWYGKLSRYRIWAATQLTKGILEIDASRLDSHPDLLNVKNGVVDLKTGELRPHDPELLLTKLAPVDYRPRARHPDWEAALAAIPEDVRDWYQLRIGQAATGYMTPDDLLVVQVGSGENGKSTIMNTLNTALGDYSTLVSQRVLLADPSAHPTELMDLQGARLALIEETPEERRLSVQRLKSVVGTPTLKARRMRQDPVEFNCTHSLFVSTNYLPIVEETDHGTWRRLACLRFPFCFRKPHEPLGHNDRPGDPGLRERLQKGEDGQLEAALAWVVEGARRWYAAGRRMPPLPPRVERDTQEWRKRSDLVLSYFSERLVPDPGRHVMSTELAQDFNSWLHARGHRPWSLETIIGRFSDHSELAKHRVRRAVVRQNPGLSRRPLGPGEVEEPAPACYHAWVGVRFRTESDPEPEGEDTWPKSPTPPEEALDPEAATAASTAVMATAAPVTGSTSQEVVVISPSGQVEAVTARDGPAHDHPPPG